MATKPTTDTAVNLADLRACTDVAALFNLFRLLRYPIASSSIAVPLDESDLPGALRDGIAARYPVARVGGERPGAPSLDVTLFVLRDPHRKSALVRGISQTWLRRFTGHHLLIFVAQDATAEGFEQIAFVHADRVGQSAEVRIKLHKLLVDRRHPTRHDADTLNRIAVPPGATADTMYQRIRDAFNVERITNDFYREYAKRFRAALERIRHDNRGVAAFYEDARLHTFTQRLFGRVMFLYFLQKKGALNGDANFVTNWYKRAVEQGENFYSSVLDPLFFETLNQPRTDQRSPRFGHVPYLNGGLFAPDADDLRGVVYLADDLFDPNSADGLLYFLNTHNFTVEEDTPLEVEVALDPEMLGKVFENLLEAEERGQTGTFYTPRPVVAFMCREALATYLARATSLDTARLGWLLDEAETGEPARDEQGRERLTNATLPRALRDRIEAALKSIRVLDPAVGSGAFPLGMLALLVGIRRALYRVAGVDVSPERRETHLVEGWKRDFIRDCLYGVDIKREAIEIARLRLWLSLVVDADPFDMEPLPNLDYKLMAGDSLIETFDGVSIYPTRPANGPAQDVLIGGEETRRLIQRLHDLQDAYFQPDGAADGAADRAALKREILDTEYAIVERTLHDRRQDERTRLEGVLLKLANLGGKAEPPALVAEQKALTHSIAATDAALADLKAGKPLPFFLYRLHFASVFQEKDGFDIVIANPPYVRHEKVAPATLATLKAAYKSVAHGMADLYVYFYARAIDLLHDGGTLCFISSNKFFRAGYGKGLRDILAKQTALRTIMDFGDFPVFDAAAYPCVVIADKGTPPPDHTYRGLTAGNAIELDKLDATLATEGQTLTQSDGARPPSGAVGGSRLVSKLMALGKPFRDFTGKQLYRGIVTGANPIFVIGSSLRDQFIQEDPNSAEILKPYLRGRFIGRYNLAIPDEWVIFTRRGIDISQYPAIRQYLELHRKDLRPKLSGENGPGRKPGNYAWYEIQDSIEYYQVFGLPKILFPELAPSAEYCYTSAEAYPDSTVYCLPTEKKWLTAIMNARLMDFLLMHISSAVRGGFYRYKKEYLQELPIVEPSEPDKQRLAALVDQLQALGGQGPGAEALEREVDAIVYRTYGLTQAEIAEIERWHDERRAMLGNGKRRQAALEADDGAEDQEAEQ